MLLNYRYYQGVVTLFGLSAIMLVTQCVSEFNPDISINDNLLVVNGSIIRGEEQQTITLSRSTSINSEEFNAIKGCIVSVMDDKNNVFRFEEDLPGIYSAEIDSEYLEIGAKFKLSIETPNNQVYESLIEEIYDSPHIDSLYFFHETTYSDDFKRDINGIRLNIDVYSDKEYNGYYLYKIHENWESRSNNANIEKMLVGVKEEFITTYRFDSLLWVYVPESAIPIPEFVFFNDPDTFHICYKESEIDELYLSTTSNITENSKKRVPLHFIPNSPKISFRYSCLVKQYTLSEGAYNYWQTKVTEIKESGDLYTTQPGQTTSNIRNINNDQETVLGYFWVSTFKEKRIFYQSPYQGNVGICSSEPFNIQDFYEMDPDGPLGTFVRIESTYLPVYISDNNTSPPICFDCRLSGGKLNKPDFW